MVNSKTLKYPIIFSAIGTKGAGRETTMVFLAEILWDRGYRDFTYTKDPYEAIEISIAIIHKPSKIIPIIMIPRLESLHAYILLENLENFICFHVHRTDYDGSQIIQTYNPDENEKWISSVTADINVCNDNTMRRLKFLLQDIYESQLTNNSKWIKAQI